MAVPSQIMQLLGRAGLRQLLAQHRAADVEDDDMEYGYRGPASRRRRRPKEGKSEFPAVPSEEGRKLMDAGVFGSSEYYRDRGRKRNTRLARKLMSRELGNDRGQTTRSPRAVAQVRRRAERAVAYLVN